MAVVEETHPGILIREAALEALDAEREREKEQFEKRSNRAFAAEFKQDIIGEYHPGIRPYPTAVWFDIGDGLSIWFTPASLRQHNPNKSSSSSRWVLFGPCATKRCPHPAEMGEVANLAALGRALDYVGEAMCPMCRQKTGIDA